LRRLLLHLKVVVLHGTNGCKMLLLLWPGRLYLLLLRHDSLHLVVLFTESILYLYLFGAGIDSLAGHRGVMLLDCELGGRARRSLLLQYTFYLFKVV